MASDYPPHVILDAVGDPIGVYRRNQDPSEIQRVHAVPKFNAYGEPIMEGAEQVVEMLPLDHPRVLAQLAKEGLKVDEGGTSLVAIEDDSAEGTIAAVAGANEVEI